MTGATEPGEITRCLSCPRGDKPPATFKWHPGMGTMPVCTEHAKEDLVEADSLEDWELDKDPVTGFLTPIDSWRPKIRTWGDWNEYHEQRD